ncbi:30S ribosomal protein S16 [Candidatus Deianiraea vastatrix]|uniref:Small ribosomal subunit protein bS16 n=1 Tax=Candidatus Deianiraea vastatrix TaxID=2163644 RepID=A0A5B8XC57_9RICK|nr:30S ribosomal protein S16 [Candidatus Deianiraea vastatrix]QED22933.1 30S ribosomal protein S16 [Candidatus Deianiraea vastatrix]
MSLKIRLSRGGKKSQPCYRIVVANSTSPRDGKFIENIGYYHPTLPDTGKRLSLDSERFLYWFKIGARPTDRVARLAHKTSELKAVVSEFFNPQKNKKSKESN